MAEEYHWGQHEVCTACRKYERQQAEAGCPECHRPYPVPPAGDEEIVKLQRDKAALLAALEARQVYAPLMPTEEIQRLLDTGAYKRLPNEKARAERELQARAAIKAAS